VQTCGGAAPPAASGPARCGRNRIPCLSARASVGLSPVLASCAPCVVVVAAVVCSIVAARCTLVAGADPSCDLPLTLHTARATVCHRGTITSTNSLSGSHRHGGHRHHTHTVKLDAVLAHALQHGHRACTSHTCTRNMQAREHEHEHEHHVTGWRPGRRPMPPP
jgi:hypothetical protein